VSFPGQERAIQSLREGLALAGRSGHVCVSAPPGVGDVESVARMIGEIGPKAGPDHDIVLVQDLDHPNRPHVLVLPPGQGLRFRDALSRLLVRLLQVVPTCLLASRARPERLRENRELERFRSDTFANVEEQIRESGYSLIYSEEEGGLPGVRWSWDGELVDLREAERRFRAPAPEGAEAPVEGVEPQPAEEVLDGFWDAEGRVRRADVEVRAFAADVEQRVVRLERESACAVMEPLFDAFKRRFPGGRRWVDRLRTYAIDRYWFFHEGETEGGSAPPPAPGWSRVAFMETPWRPGTDEEPGQLMASFMAHPLHQARPRRACAVTTLEAPTWSSLLGGLVVEPSQNRRPDWRDLRAGALLDASGGILVLPLGGIYSGAGCWRGLKQVLRDGRITLQNADVVGIGLTSPLVPDPIPVDVRVVVVGDPETIAFFRETDPEFSEVFRYTVEMESAVPASAASAATLGRWLEAEARHLDFTLEATGRDAVLEWSFSVSPLPGCLTLGRTRLVEILREAGMRARGPITRVDVESAVRRRQEREDQAERRLKDAFSKGELLVETGGAVVGQVNALAVYTSGDHAFGRPLRVTAAVGTGRGGIVNIEREAGLSGRLHDKGIQILSGILRDRFGRGRVLALTASLCMEQSYGRVDGDSASVAECCALLSAIGRVPLRQDVAVTGSLQQFGQIQAIGGVNSKIRAFYEVCRDRGLSSTQGVLIPAANRRDLHLSWEIVADCERGAFHVWTAATLDEAIALLTGLEHGQAGPRGEYPSGTFGAAVAHALDALQDVVRIGGRKRSRDR